MRTSLNELQQIEDYLLRQENNPAAAGFEVRLALQPSLQESVLWQQQTYDLIQAYGRMRLKAEIENVHQKLFHSPAHRRFRQSILQLFSRK